MSQSLISQVHDKVVSLETHYKSIEEKCNKILAWQTARKRLGPVWVTLMVAGAFALGKWVF